jgi:hypothetical protein
MRRTIVALMCGYMLVSCSGCLALLVAGMAGNVSDHTTASDLQTKVTYYNKLCAGHYGLGVIKFNTLYCADGFMVELVNQR